MDSLQRACERPPESPSHCRIASRVAPLSAAHFLHDSIDKERPMKRTIVLMLLLFFVLCSLLRAQIANEAAVLGTVTDQSGAAVVGAVATARNLDTGFTKEATTNASG